jgi:hypothetical protein
MRERAVGPTRALWRGLSSFAGPRAAALANSTMSWGAARDGLPARPLLELREPRVTCPGSLRELPRDATANGAMTPRAGHRPCPAWSLKLERVP